MNKMPYFARFFRMVPDFDTWMIKEEPTIIEALRGVADEEDDITPRLFRMYLKSMFEQEIIWN